MNISIFIAFSERIWSSNLGLLQIIRQLNSLCESSTFKVSSDHSKSNWLTLNETIIWIFITFFERIWSSNLVLLQIMRQLNSLCKSSSLKNYPISFKEIGWLKINE
jgi:hypothetical protein